MILVVISLYHSFLVSFFPILRMTITLYIYSVQERMKGWMKKTTIYQFEDVPSILKGIVLDTFKYVLRYSVWHPLGYVWLARISYPIGYDMYILKMISLDVIFNEHNILSYYIQWDVLCHAYFWSINKLETLTQLTLFFNLLH